MSGSGNKWQETTTLSRTGKRRHGEEVVIFSTLDRYRARMSNDALCSSGRFRAV